jgi:hypothetical protein
LIPDDVLPVITNFLSRILPARDNIAVHASIATEQSRPPLQAVGINDFLRLDIPAREMLARPDFA